MLNSDRPGAFPQWARFCVALLQEHLLKSGLEAFKRALVLLGSFVVSERELSMLSEMTGRSSHGVESSNEGLLLFSPFGRGSTFSPLKMLSDSVCCFL